MPQMIPPHLQRELDNLKTLRKLLDYLYDGEQKAFEALYYIKNTYEKEWMRIFKYLADNQIRGKKIVEFFQNESDETGGGYLMGVTLIMSRIKGQKTGTTGLKINELVF